LLQLTVLALTCPLVAAPAAAQVISGGYTGNGTDNVAIDLLGFQPDVVIVKAATAEIGVIRTSTMAGDLAKPMTGVTALTAGLIKSLNPLSFTIGTDVRVNASGTAYSFIAFKQAAKRMKVGTYTGTVGAQSITGIGFSPDVVVIIPASASEAVYRSAADTETFRFDTFAGSGAAQWISSLDPDGFSVGAYAQVNASGTTYHYIAWNEVAGVMDVGTYSGDGNPGTPVGAPLLRPEYVMVKRDGASGAVHHPASLGQTADNSSFFTATANQANRIQQLSEDGFVVGTANEVNRSGSTYHYFAWRRTLPDAQVISGSYVGNGADNTAITGVGFSPDAVLVKANSARSSIIRMWTAYGDYAVDMQTGQVAANLIQSLDAEGFTIGTDPRVNAGGVTYNWVAWQRGAGQMEVGLYTGNGAASRSVADVGFAPDFVMVVGYLGPTVYRNSAGTTDFNFIGGSDGSWITALGADGFTVSNLQQVNTNSYQYAWAAWKEIPGVMDVGSYTGDGSDNRNITGVGFLPQFVMTQTTAPGAPVAHSLAMGSSTDLSHFFIQTPHEPDQIQALQTDGFQVGTAPESNESGTAFVYAAWAASTITAVQMARMSATRTDAGVKLEWRTGYETSNLGFHIYRDDLGEMRRLTSAPVKGRALLLGPGSDRQDGFSYRWTDTGAGPEEIRYWIEDLDLDGTTTMNGPVVAAAQSQVGAREQGWPVYGWLGPGSDPNGLASASPVAASKKDVAENGEGRTREAASVGPKSDPVRAKRPVFPGPTSPPVTAAPQVPVAPVPAMPPTSIVRSVHFPGTARERRPSSTPGMKSQWRVADGAAARIRVRTAGWYQVTQAELIAAGIDPATDPRRLKLLVEGVEQPLIVRGEADGRFDPEDCVEFYGVGTDTPYTDSRIYWLTDGGSSGSRITRTDAVPRNTTFPVSFAHTVVRRDRSIYFAALLNGEPENFFGELITGDFVTEQLMRVSQLDRAGARTVRLEVRLQGVTDDPENRHHEVAVSLNGHAIGAIRFAGRDQAVGAWDVDAAWIIEGDNIIGLLGSSEFDYTMVDTIRLTYMRLYVPEDHQLRATAEAGSDVLIGPFEGPAIRLIDVTEPTRPTELAGLIESRPDGFVVRARVNGTGTRSLLAFTPEGALVPGDVTANAPTAWHRDAASADVVLISHRSFMSSLQPLTSLREQQGHRVALVDVEDVYDEFSFGEKTPFALRRFLAHTHLRNRDPRYVLLVGNATNDPRDYYGFGEPDFVPTKIIATGALEAPSDDWFVDENEDGYPELGIIGRLPVRSAEDTSVMVRKILEYEKAANEPWTRSVLLVAEPPADGGFDYQAASAALRPLVPSGYAVAALDSPRAAATRDAVVSHINQGQLLVNFVGHGSVEEWGGGLLARTDVPELTNGSRLPLVVAMNCLNGFFHSLFPEESLAESLIRAANGGAIAVWASSSVTSPQWQARMNRELFRQLFDPSARTAGEAVIAAKRMVGDPDVRQSWIFFGDPLMRLKGMRDERAIRPAQDLPRRSPAEPVVRVDEATDGMTIVASAHSTVRQQLVDFNGDGVDDLLLYDAAASEWRVAINARGRFEVRARVEGVPAEPYPAHLNDDRLMDVFWYDSKTGAWSQALHRGDGTFNVTSGAWVTDWNVLVADFDGDARTDVFLYEPNTGAWFQNLSDGAGGFRVLSGVPLPIGVARVVNLNVDAAADLLIQGGAAGAWATAVNTGQGQFATCSLQWDPRLHAQPGDLNGDGRTDFVLWHPGSTTWTEAVSRTSGRFTYRQHPRTTEGQPHAVDLDGDRREEVLWYDDRSGAWSLDVTEASGVSVSFTGRWASGWDVASGNLDANAGRDLLLYNTMTGVWTRVSLTPDGPIGTLTGTLTGRWSVLGIRR
jgi:hypothetical protein